MGQNLGPLNIKDTYQSLVQISGSQITNGTGSLISNLQVTASHATTATYADNTVVTGKNLEATTIAKGTPVYFTDSGTSGNIVGLYRADAGNVFRMPAGGVAGANIDAGAEGIVLLDGFIGGVNTSLFTSGDEIFVGVGGGYTNEAPTGSALIQKLGNVEKVGISNGSGVIQMDGEARGLPNVANGSTWVGDANGVPQATAVSSLSVASASYATTADTATSASHAVNADTAISASYATNAANATSASYATNAANATSASFATNARNAYVQVSAANVDYHVTFNTINAGYKELLQETEGAQFTYNPSNNKLTVENIAATTLSGSLSGNATTATSASYASVATSASYALTASFLEGSAGEKSGLISGSGVDSLVSTFYTTTDALAEGTGSIAIGNAAQVTGSTSENTVVIGPNANSKENSVRNVIIGHNAQMQEANRNDSVIIGASAAGYQEGVAVGANSFTIYQAVAIGKDAYTNDNYGIAVGAGARTNNNGGIAIGSGSLQDGDGSIAIGKGVVASDANDININNTWTYDSSAGLTLIAGSTFSGSVGGLDNYRIRNEGAGAAYYSGRGNSLVAVGVDQLGQQNFINGGNNAELGFYGRAGLSSTPFVMANQDNLVTTVSQTGGLTSRRRLNLSSITTGNGGLLSFLPWNTLPAASSNANTIAVSGSVPYFSDGSTWTAMI